MEMKSKTQALLYKQLFENNLNNKNIDKNDFEKAKQFLLVLTGVSFSDEELIDRDTVNRITYLLNGIQKQITEFRTEIKLTPKQKSNTV